MVVSSLASDNIASCCCSQFGIRVSHRRGHGAGCCAYGYAKRLNSKLKCDDSEQCTIHSTLYSAEVRCGVRTVRDTTTAAQYSKGSPVDRVNHRGAIGIQPPAERHNLTPREHTAAACVGRAHGSCIGRSLSEEFRTPYSFFLSSAGLPGAPPAPPLSKRSSAPSRNQLADE